MDASCVHFFKLLITNYLLLILAFSLLSYKANVKSFQKKGKKHFSFHLGHENPIFHLI